MFVSATSPIVFCIYNFVFSSFLFYVFLPARVAPNKRVFMLRLACVKGNNKINVHPIPTIMFKNILRAFETEILKYLRTPFLAMF